MYHTDSHALEQDTRYSRVFVSKEFYYFGEEIVDIPARFRYVIHRAQSLKYVRAPDRTRPFIRWLTLAYPPGVHGLPRHREGAALCERGADQKLLFALQFCGGQRTVRIRHLRNGVRGDMAELPMPCSS